MNAPTPPSPPPTLYHYTSPSAFLGILQSASVWATKIQYMNDVRELKEAVAVAGWHFTRIQSALHRPDIDEACRLLHESLERIAEINVFVFCLSEIGDQLSQWRAYCPKGGLALGFNTSELTEAASAYGFHLVPCLYHYADQRSLMGPVVEGAIAEFDRLRIVNPGVPSETIREHVLPTFFIDFLKVAPQIKHQAFAEEREWRLVSKWMPSDNAQVGFRTAKELIIPHFAIPLRTPGGPLVQLDDIVLGPAQHQRLLGSAMSTVTERHKELIKWKRISYSQIPFRPL